MRYALLSDIHANREAFDAVLAQLGGHRIDKIVLLGDLVGYGADPAYCVERARDLLDTGAIGILGNHDAAIAGSHEDMNSAARAAIDWTRTQLMADHLAVLARLVPAHREDDLLLVHASARTPLAWHYIIDAASAERSLRATDARMTIVGHVHVPCLWRLISTGTATRHVPVTGQEIPLAASQIWLGVMGAVGQPRDGSPAAAFGILDTRARTLSFERIAYDHYQAARKVREAGLPMSLAERLLLGR
jgi:diadenosine tetraphosphatase ApaH/serine/threonine PP2A family protein phosphatase